MSFMWERFVSGLRKTLSLKQAVVIFAFCMLISASFAFGAAMGRTKVPANVPPVQQPAPAGWENVGPFGHHPPRGTVGAIDRIDGDVIRMRDPRSGRTWRVRAGNDTVIEFGRQRRIPFENLRVGQRIFVVGVLESNSSQEFESAEEFDAQFIGVLLGQQQKYIKPVREPMLCWDCTD